MEEKAPENRKGSDINVFQWALRDDSSISEIEAGIRAQRKDLDEAEVKALAKKLHKKVILVGIDLNTNKFIFIGQAGI